MTSASINSMIECLLTLSDVLIFETLFNGLEEFLKIIKERITTMSATGQSSLTPFPLHFQSSVSPYVSRLRCPLHYRRDRVCNNF